MSGKQASSKKKSSKVVNVELEKLTEQNSVKPATTRAPPELVASIKNSAQLEEELVAKQQQEELEQIEAQFKNRVLFYGGVVCAIGIGYLLHRYYTGPSPPKELVHELVNGVANAVTK